MTIFQSMFDVNTTFFVFLEYPISYLEFIGTIFYLGSVWLIAQKNMLTWPIGIISVILYGILFYQIQLYSDALEQFYYLGASIYGWMYWNRTVEKKEESTGFRYSSSRHMTIWGIICFVFSILLTIFMVKIHVIFPVIFPEPASFPFLDAFTTVMSFIAMYLMAQKRIESWIYWITVDVIGIVLYFVKDVKFISLLYVLLLIIAIRGLAKWNKEKE